MLSNSCIYLQLEAQKASIMTALAEHIKKELLKITQITTLQNTLHPNHSSSSCPNCHLLRANPFGQNLLELTAMQAMSSSINDLKSSMAELSKLIPYNSPSQTPSICSESLETKELSNSLTSATKINQNQDIIVKDEDDGQESNDTSNDQSLKSVPKIDKMRHMGFKPQSSSQVNTSNKTQKKKSNNSACELKQFYLNYQNRIKRQQQSACQKFSLKDALKCLMLSQQQQQSMN